MKVLPQTQAGKLQLLERRAEHILGNHEPAFGRHDDTLRRERAVCHLRIHTVKRPHGSQELPDQDRTRCRDRFQPAAARRDPRRGTDALPATHSDVTARLEAGSLRRSARRTRLRDCLRRPSSAAVRSRRENSKPGARGQRGAHAKNLDELSNGVVECTHPHPEPVLERACSCPEPRDIWGGELNSHEQLPEANRTHRRAGATALQPADHTGTPRDPLVKSLASKVLLPTDLDARRSLREPHFSGSSR